MIHIHPQLQRGKLNDLHPTQITVGKAEVARKRQFSEFLWADFFRPRIAADAINSNMDKALAKGIKLARSQDARYLPGWSGIVEAN